MCAVVDWSEKLSARARESVAECILCRNRAELLCAVTERGQEARAKVRRVVRLRRRKRWQEAKKPKFERTIKSRGELSAERGAPKAEVSQALGKG